MYSELASQGVASCFQEGPDVYMVAKVIIMEVKTPLLYNVTQ